jgi:hypothetical protein
MSWSQSSEAVTTGEMTAAITASALLKASNLSDLTDPVAARYNLGLHFFGNMLTVDAVFGDDLLGSSGGFPYATVEAALADAVDGDVIWLFPGHHVLAAGITVPTGVSLVGTAHRASHIEMHNVVADTTLITMGTRSSVENLTLHLTSVEHHTLIGVLFPGTTSEDALLDGCDVFVDNSTASDLGTSNVYGIRSTGTGVPREAFNSIVNSTIDVDSAGLGNKRGALVDTAAHTFSIDTAYISCERIGAGAGSYIGEEVNFAGATLINRLGTVSGIPTADISQTLGTMTLGTPQLVNATANGLGFSTITQIPSFGWGDNGAAASGTRYLYIGTATPSTNEAGIVFGSKACMLNMSVRALTGPGGARTDTWTIRKNGVDTGLTVSLTGAATTSTTSNVSVTFQAGDVVSVKQVISASSTTDDVQIRCSYV